MAVSSSSFLLLLSLSQFLLIFFLIYKIGQLHHQQQVQVSSTVSPQLEVAVTSSSSPASSVSSSIQRDESSTSSLSCDWRQFQKPAGVAVTLMLHTPTWFQRRYTMMIQNAHENIPDDWVVQVYYTGLGQSLKGLEINRGIQKLIDIGRVRLTIIPPELFKRKKRKIELLTDQWIWQNMLAEKVLLFGGTSVICSNSPRSIQQYLHFDYIGAPWGNFKGCGGDGSISLRSRSLMLKVLDYELSKHDSEEDKSVAYKKWGQEDYFFVSRIVEMQKKGVPGMENVRISTKNESMGFAAIGGWYSDDVWAVSGILAEVPFKERDKFMSLCPETKLFYPSLHEPACFGASPESERCAKSICALKPKTERKGGC